MIRTKGQELEAKRQDVREAFVSYGLKSQQYRDSFEELHNLNMVFMADSFRRSHGLPEWASTPYS